jgi:hypothetical protein
MELKMQSYYNSYQPYQTPYTQRQVQGYPNYQYQPQMPTTNPMMSSNNAPQPIVAYVNGIEGAKGYILYPKQSAISFDSDNREKFYIKNADASGVPTIERYIKINEDSSPMPTCATDNEYVTRREFEALKEMLKENKYDNTTTNNANVE